MGGLKEREMLKLIYKNIMKINTVKGIEISALSLGTVQLGLSYGINNADGKPSQETANAILNAALDGGINTLDTAGAYGDSEVVIGNWLKTGDPAKRQELELAMLKLHQENQWTLAYVEAAPAYHAVNARIQNFLADGVWSDIYRDMGIAHCQCWYIAE